MRHAAARSLSVLPGFLRTPKRLKGVVSRNKENAFLTLSILPSVDVSGNPHQQPPQLQQSFQLDPQADRIYMNCFL